MGSLRGRTRLSDFTFTFHFHALEKKNGNPPQCACLETPRDGGAWWAAVYGVAQSRTRLKRLSSSSSSSSGGSPGPEAPSSSCIGETSAEPVPAERAHCHLLVGTGKCRSFGPRRHHRDKMLMGSLPEG